MFPYNYPPALPTSTQYTFSVCSYNHHGPCVNTTQLIRVSMSARLRHVSSWVLGSEGKQWGITSGSYVIVFVKDFFTNKKQFLNHSCVLKTPLELTTKMPRYCLRMSFNRIICSNRLTFLDETDFLLCLCTAYSALLS